MFDIIVPQDPIHILLSCPAVSSPDPSFVPWLSADPSPEHLKHTRTSLALVPRRMQYKPAALNPQIGPRTHMVHLTGVPATCLPKFIIVIHSLLDLIYKTGIDYITVTQEEATTVEESVESEHGMWNLMLGFR
jgi:hypothetical protein